MWPTPEEAAQRFYDSNLKSAVGLMSSIAADRRSRGSGRPPGQPQAEWRAVLVLALAALEAGLVDVGLVAHYHRFLSRSTVASNGNEMDSTRGRLLNSMPLSAPNAQKIENFMMAHFGVLRSMITVPDVANFTARCKQKARGGSGSGTTLQFSGGWDELAVRLDAIQYFRNAIVHADSQKLAEIPQSLSALSSSLRSSMWAEKENSSWSLQMPHAVTAVRTAAAVFNTVAFTLYNAVGLDASDMAVLKPPDEVVPFNG